MRLLIITQKVDSSDHNLGFFVRWIEEFAKHCASVTVICLENGNYHLLNNIRVLSLGKEGLKINDKGLRILLKLQYALRFLRYIVFERKNYDGVFVHMNPEYVLLGGLLWRLLRKQVGFWYTHKSKRLLQSALIFIDHVFTPSLGSFPIMTKKERIVGHGIDTKLFLPRASGRTPGSPPIILSDTRLTPSKHVERTIEISRELQKLGVRHFFNIIGAPITEEDMAYEKRLREEISKENLPVAFIGGVPFALVPDYYGKANLFINHSNVGALNKTVLQAMSMNIPVLTSNESYRGILPDDAIVQETPNAFAKKIQAFLTNPILVSYREQILQEHSLQALIPKILHSY